MGPKAPCLNTGISNRDSTCTGHSLENGSFYSFRGKYPSANFLMANVTKSKKTGRIKYLFTGGRECNSCDLSHDDVKESGRSVFLNRALLEEAAADVNNKDRLEIHFTLVIKKK